MSIEYKEYKEHDQSCERSFNTIESYELPVFNRVGLHRYS